MKLRIEKNSFIKSWQMAERNTSTTSTLSVLSGIRCLADGNSIILQATDLKTSVTCRAAGVTVEEPGEVVFPIKVVGELFKKVPADSFIVDVQAGKANLSAGKSHYRFTTYPVEEFPKLPVSSAARLLFGKSAIRGAGPCGPAPGDSGSGPTVSYTPIPMIGRICGHP